MRGSDSEEEYDEEELEDDESEDEVMDEESEAGFSMQ